MVFYDNGSDVITGWKPPGELGRVAVGARFSTNILEITIAS